MSVFKNVDIEVQNTDDVVTEHIEGSVTTAGVPVTISATGGNKILKILMINQNKGTNANNPTDLLLINTDGGSVYTTVQRGGTVEISCYLDDFKVDSNNDGTKYEIILHKEEN